MTEWLYPCPSCDRHVQSSASQCPWCGAALPQPPPAPPPVSARVSDDRLLLQTLYGAPPPPRYPVPMYGAPPPPLRRRLAIVLLVGLTVLAAAWLLLSKLLHVF